MPFVRTCLTCLCTLLAFVPQITTCLRALIFHVSTCLHFSRVYLLTCVYIYIFFMPTCLCVLNYFVPTRALFSHAYVPTTTHKIYWGSLLYLVLLLFSGLFDLSFHSKPQNKLLLLKLHTSILSYGVLLFQLVHAQTQYCEDSLRSYLKQWTLSSILNSYATKLWLTTPNILRY